jgi:dihydrolipoamide dehydrogenase
VAAIRAAQLGGRVVAIEREELGGVCLNWGCIPTKTLIHTAHLYHKLQHADRFGLDVSGLGVNLKALVKRKNEVVKSNKAGIRNLFKANGIQLVQGNAKVTGPHSILVGDEQIEANAIIIATGSSPAQLPGLETDGKRVITSTEALDLEELPKSAVIVGAGAIGAEFASMWNAFGVNVTLVEMLPRVLPNDDEEISQRMGDLFKKRKIDVRTETTVKKLDVGKKGVHVEFDGAKAGAVDADLVLVGIGRRYHSEVVSETPGLGVELGQRGKINVNERMETTVPSIYAIGDVVGKTMLAHGASAEGLVAAANAMGASKTMDYRVVPACTFTSPEVASVGLTETKAKAAGIETKVGRFNMMASGRAHTMGETDGMVKIIGNAKTDQVIGVHIMGPEAGELIAAAALAIRLEATVEDIAHTIHTHPTLAETVMEAAEDYYGAGIHTPPSRSA